MTATGTEDELRETAERLHAAAIRLLRTLRREDDGSGLTAPRLSALSVIVFAGPLSLAALAEAEQVRPPTMSRIVDALVAGGLVTRTPDPDDRRTVRIAATEAGTALLHAGRARRVEALVARLAGLSGPDRRALARGTAVLERMLR
jgi:DNA-binding MarR family transcriptional regulator